MRKNDRKYRKLPTARNGDKIVPKIPGFFWRILLPDFLISCLLDKLGGRFDIPLIFLFGGRGGEEASEHVAGGGRLLLKIEGRGGNPRRGWGRGGGCTCTGRMSAGSAFF